MDGVTNRLTEKLYSNSRMDLDFFMYFPKASYLTKDKQSVEINMNPVLYLRYKKPKEYNSEFDYTKASYKINPRNFYHIIKFFNTIIQWFYEDEYKDLFLYNEEGRLIFNADYKRLSVSMPVDDYNNQYLQAVPSIVELGGKTYEGVILFVNKTEYQIPLKYSEVESIFGILKAFRFSEEISKILYSYMFLLRRKQIQEYEMKKKTPFD